ncbi:MAG: hypothetical protein ABJG15_18480 [Hyphomonadaceae bacterium]
MNFRKLMLAGGAIAALIGAPAQASIVDNPQFRVLGMVIVWGGNAPGTAGLVSDFIIDDVSGAGDTDLIAGDVNTVVTGSLTATTGSFAGATSIVDGANTLQTSSGVLDASTTFNAFDLTDSTDIQVGGLTETSSFYIASNTNFNIDAVATAVTEDGFTLADIGYNLEVTLTGDDGVPFGADAQFPGGSATGGVETSINTLADMDGTDPVFIGTQRTAATPGSIADQSVRFDATYSLGGSTGYDLSQGAGEVEANVVYTVFVPYAKAVRTAKAIRSCPAFVPGSFFCARMYRPASTESRLAQSANTSILPA